MPDREVYERALDELRQCEERAAQLRSFITLYEELRGVAAKGGGATAAEVPSRDENTNANANADTAPAPQAAGTSGPRRPPTTAEATERMVVAYLRETGHPVQRRELYEALVEKGLVIPGSNPVEALGTRLYRMRDTIENIRGVGYWLKGVPLPEDAAGLEQAGSEEAPEGETHAGGYPVPAPHTNSFGKPLF